ncbi:hypothetical protein TM102_31930 [Bradyrhizobium sp. TM102]|nr:hypothetical protein TM102_31930 [Bradyrhizobium sp. TM102]
MGTLQIVDRSPGIEGALDFREGAEAPHGKNLGLQGAMEAFVLAAGLRVTGPGVHNPDTELEQPHLQPGPTNA